MSVNHLRSVLLRQVMWLRPKERITPLRDVSWLMVGIHLCRSVHLTQSPYAGR
jgi:hypothetical protein